MTVMGVVTNKIRHLSDGWHSLPIGGALLVKSGRPIRVTDKGDWTIDELSLLREAESFTGFKLNYTYARGKRWRDSSLSEVLFKKVGSTWSFANIYSGVCFRCGDDAGSYWWQESEGGHEYWICSDCKEDLEKGIGWDD